MARRRHLGKLTKTPTSNAPSTEARRVVSAFLRGEAARGACKPAKKGKPRTCAIVSDGRNLEVDGNIIASRQGNRMTVCTPVSAYMETHKGRQRETAESKDVRVAASMLLRRAAGVSVRTSPAGERLLAAKGRAALLLPTACLQVQVPKRQAAKVAATAAATDAAKTKYKVQFPSRAQVEAMRKVLDADRRMAALYMAQRKRGLYRPTDEYDYTPAGERDVPFDVENLLEPAGEEEVPPPEAWEMTEAQATGLPKDVPNPTDPDAYALFVTEYLPKLKKGRKRDAALAWQAYLLDPKNAPAPGFIPGLEVQAGSAERKRAVRQVELELAGKYGIIDPIHGFTDPVTMQRQAAIARGQRQAQATRNRKGKGRGKGWVSEIVKEQLLKNRNYLVWEERYGRKSRGY